MATVINNPDTGADRGGGVGLIVGIIIAIVVIALVLLYGLPAFRRGTTGTSVNVPDKINVDVNGGSTGGGTGTTGQ